MPCVCTILNIQCVMASNVCLIIILILMAINVSNLNVSIQY